MGKINDLIDGVNGFTFTATAADIEHAGNELILEACRVRETLEFALASADQRRHANGLTTVTADNCAISFRNYRR